MKPVRSLWLLLATLLTGFIRGTSLNPGLRVTVTDKGLDYLCQVGLPFLKLELASISIPDISDSYSIAVVGKIDYKLYKIQLQNLSIPNLELKSGGKGITVYSSGISVSGSAQWHYRKHSWPHISDSGSCDLSVTGTSLSISMVVGKDDIGHATLNTTRCSVSVNSLNVKFHGGTSWLYNLFDKEIAKGIKKSLNKQVCKQATKAIRSQGNKTLESLPVILKLDNVAEIDYSLLQNPVFTTTYVQFSLKGEFLSISNPKEAPFNPSPLPAEPTSGKMAHVWLTDYIVNSAGYVYQSAGMLTYAITRDLIPKMIPNYLNTSFFKTSLQQLYNAFPNMDMQLTLNATKPPVLQLFPNSANLTITGAVDVLVIQPNKTVATAFVLGVTVHADVDVFLYSSGSQQRIVGNATSVRPDLSLISSNIGQFSVSDLQDVVNILVTILGIPALNYYGNIGLAIPVVDGITFVNPELMLGQGYAVILTDISYQP